MNNDLIFYFCNNNASYCCFSQINFLFFCLTFDLIWCQHWLNVYSLIQGGVRIIVYDFPVHILNYISDWIYTENHFDVAENVNICVDKNKNTLCGIKFLLLCILYIYCQKIPWMSVSGPFSRRVPRSSPFILSLKMKTHLGFFCQRTHPL